MYKFDKNHPFALADFNQPMGLKMNPENRWVKRAETIPWDAISFVPSLLVEFRKRLTAEVLEEINEMIIAYNTPDDPTSTGGGNHEEMLAKLTLCSVSYSSQ